MVVETRRLTTKGNDEEGVRFESQRKRRLPWLMFCLVLFSSSKQKLVQYHLPKQCSVILTAPLDTPVTLPHSICSLQRMESLFLQLWGREQEFVDSAACLLCCSHGCRHKVVVGAVHKDVFQPVRALCQFALCLSNQQSPAASPPHSSQARLSQDFHINLIASLF